MKKTLLTLALAVGIAIQSFADKVPIEKHRDKFRLFGYGKVVVNKEGHEEAGEIIIDVIRIECSGAGNLKCRENQSLTFNEIDEFEEYTPAERNIAQTVIYNGDIRIDNGQVAGNESVTVQFQNTGNNQSYYRTFSYVWSTNSQGEVYSSLIISDPF